ncbi:MAG: aldehyde dehydrogenase family protein [Myxococcales bacterium FL481]|nr:MAG: aldehyde dehydrogenase family protein [Myxococcales bacterium FL481]
MSHQAMFASLGLADLNLNDGDLVSHSPIDGQTLGRVASDDEAQIDAKIAHAHEAYLAWRAVPAPRRGEFVRCLGEELRAHKQALGELVTLECGKITQEGLGEVQEMIDICDFAVGLSRQLYGLTIASERPEHAMRETWHPLGPVAVISAFNFPVAVWAWNAAIAFVCGDSVLWKPSEKTPLTALACQQLVQRAAAKCGDVPTGLSQLVIGERAAGEQLVDDRRIPLVSATGSCAMGRTVAPRVAARFGRSILELGGNNAIVVTPSADLDLAVRSIVFGAVGTAGQRCTTTRRLFVHPAVRGDLLERLRRAYGSLQIGDPREPGTLVGPLIDEAAFSAMRSALDELRSSGATVHGGQRVLADRFSGAYYAQPALVEMPASRTNIAEETFAPILHVFEYERFEEAIARQNDVPQGLSSAVFTNDVREAEHFVSVAGSDCGIANVNIGTSGAEIGGAFGGEKETGGGREAGSDSWKAYMRRSTSTVNYGRQLPLAQGIEFDV